ncbi:MAG TPA: hypothetical protein VE548_15795 [Nitrososphaeraceae archaeon]|nr:hypothetical protein [Nitrososphaeraceae archaeon]
MKRRKQVCIGKKFYHGSDTATIIKNIAWLPCFQYIGNTNDDIDTNNDSRC